MKIPNVQPDNKIKDQLVETIDIFPTVMEIARIKSRYTHFGISLIPLIKGEEKIHRDAVFAEGGFNNREPQCLESPVKNPNIPLMGIYYDKTNIPAEKPSTVARSAMVRTVRWKLVIRSSKDEELYDLDKDPEELINLINDKAYSNIKEELKERLLRWYLNTSDNAHWKKRRDI